MSPYRPRFFLGVCSSFAGLFTGLGTFLGRVERMEQSFLRAVPHVFETTDTSSIETEGSEFRRRVRLKQTYEKNKKVRGGRIEPLLCNCGNRRIRKAQSFLLPDLQEIASVMTHGVHEFLRYYQGTKHFPRNQRLSLESPSWRVLDSEGNPLGDENVERQREQNFRSPQVVRDREYPLSEDLIVDTSGSVDVSLPPLSKVSALIEALRLGGSYELVHQLSSQFILFAEEVNVDVTWSRDEVLGNALLLPYCT